jgi:hypothetical protein
MTQKNLYSSNTKEGLLKNISKFGAVFNSLSEYFSDSEMSMAEDTKSILEKDSKDANLDVLSDFFLTWMRQRLDTFEAICCASSYVEVAICPPLTFRVKEESNNFSSLDVRIRGKDSYTTVALLKKPSITSSYSFVDKPKSPSIPMSMSLPQMELALPQVFVGVVEVPAEEKEFSQPREESLFIPAIPDSDAQVKRVPSQRTILSNLTVLMVYESGSQVLANMKYAVGGRCVVLEPKVGDRAYHILSAEDVPENGVPVKLQKGRYTRLYHTPKNSKIIEEILKK